jgi:glutamate--cysteine ligase
VGFIGLGAAPIWKHEDMPMMPKGRYKLMTDYMDRVGTLGKTMMYRTCTVQVNLDFASEADMVKKLRVALALQPVATALFANSPFIDGQAQRAQVLAEPRLARSGRRPHRHAALRLRGRVRVRGLGRLRARCADVLRLPRRQVHRCAGPVVPRFPEGESCPRCRARRPTLSDWADHLTTIFPEARIKKFIEMRGADGGPWRRLCALPAFWVGLTYDQGALDAAWDLVKGWDAETRDALRVAASVHALDAKVGQIDMHELAREVLEIAEAGLDARAREGAGGLIPDETHFLSALKESVESGKVPADELLEHYQTDWAGDLTRIYGEYSY